MASAKKSGNWETENNNKKGKADTIKLNRTMYGGLSSEKDRDYFFYRSVENQNVEVYFGGSEINCRVRIYVNGKLKLSQTAQENYSAVKGIAELALKKGDKVYIQLDYGVTPEGYRLKLKKVSAYNKKSVYTDAALYNSATPALGNYQKAYEKNKTFTLLASNAYGPVSYWSSDKSVVTVGKTTGKVKVRGTGCAQITVSAGNGTTTGMVYIVPGKNQITKISKKSSTSLRAYWKKDTKADGYQIQIATNSKFTENLKEVEVTGYKKNAVTFADLITGKNYYVRVRAYISSDGVNYYSSWSKSKKCKLTALPTIENTKSVATIEADVTLTGSGTGYHAKLVICSPTSAVSFGIQYDAYAEAPYTGKAMALIENVASNAPGGQQYIRPGNKSLALGKTYHMMMTIDKNGNGAVYLDYEKIGTFTNTALAKEMLYLRVEGSGRLNGDNVNAVFQNIKLKNGGTYDVNKGWGTHEFKTNPTIHSKINSDGTVKLSGYVSGLPAGGDWDNCYESVSNIIQFVQ